ncbi:MAG: FAD-dependent oxidoreductase [Microbacterium sp.]
MQHRSVHSDLTVVGGGLAGVSAAISAARLGRRVALVNNRPVLGGNSSSEIRVWVCGATAHGMQRYARETGVIGELYVENQYRNPEGNPIHWDEVVLDAVRAEPNISLFLNTDVRHVTAADVDGERVVTSVTGWTMGSEIETEFTSPYVVDATGDGLVGLLAGAEYRLGREARHEFDEDWAPEVADEQALGSTILFYTKDLGRPVRFVAPDSAKDITQTPIPESRIIRSGDNGAKYWWIEWGGELDIVHDNERIRDELRSVIFGIWDHIKNSGRFDADNLDLEWVGALPGKREYRRFLGDHVLSQRDILEQRVFPDAVAFGGWSIDLHPVEGMYATVAGAHQRYSDGIFGIPLRSLYSRNVANLFLAGRDISATHVAFGATRVMATCATTGEAVGAAASLALELGVRPRVVATEHADRVQQLLLRQDASIFGVANTDPLDLARDARTTSSSVLRSVDPLAGAPDAEIRGYPLAEDLAILVPVDPALESVSVRVTAPAGAWLTASLWTTGRAQNAVPIREELRTMVTVAADPEPQWVDLPLAWAPPTPENVVIVLEAAEGVELELAQAVAPGILALPHTPADDGDANVAVSHDEALVRWPAHPLRGWGPRLRVTPETRAYAAEKAIAGYQRPFGGPQLWVSEAFGPAESEWLRLDWDDVVTVATVRLVFDDDVDVELNTLHHHRTPDPVFPELVRDYRVQALVDGDWKTLADVSGNRRRQRVHRFAEPVEATAVRVAIDATNGDPHARIVSLRVYGD